MNISLTLYVYSYHSLLLKWQIILYALWYAHKVIPRAWLIVCICCIGLLIITVICIFTLAKFLFLNNNISRINLIAILVCVTASLDSACYGNLSTLFKVLLCKLSALAKCNAVDKIGCLSITLFLKFTIYSQCISRPM